MTRIAVFGDIHGNLPALDAVLEDIAVVEVDLSICLGDLVGYGPFPNDVIERIRALDIPTIMGNYDDGIGFERGDCGCYYATDRDRSLGQMSVAWTAASTTPANRVWLQTLLPDYRLAVNGCRLRFVHGSPRRINEYLLEDRDPRSLARIAAMADCDVLVFGHTHKPWHRTIRGIDFINAGSVGKPKDGDPRACWVLLDVGSDGTCMVETRRVAYNIESVTSAIRHTPGLPNAFAQVLESGT